MPTWCSASQMFVQHGAITFLAVIRKQQFSLDYCVRCAHVIMLLPKRLSAVIVFGALL